MTLSLPPLAGLAYCRHLSTVRTHLSALVNHMIVSPDLPYDAGHGLTAMIWEQYLQDSTVRLGLVQPAEGQTQRVRWGVLSSEKQTQGCCDVLGLCIPKLKAPSS